MINHQHKVIFIHIPKCAGSSIKDFYFDYPKLDWRKPNYELLYGWCPKRKIHLQHATSRQLLEMNLIDPKIWESYYKFTFVRNPYDRSYSDYLWIQQDRNLKDSFRNYIKKEGAFKKVLSDNSIKEYRGDHLLNQTDFFDLKGEFELDFVGRFESLNDDISSLNKTIGIKKKFNIHAKNNKKRKKHYSHFYTGSKIKLVNEYYEKDIKLLGYSFIDMKKGLNKIKQIF